MPPAVGALLGRAAERSRVTEALEDARLVTLTGAPGIGKTRLARAVAEGYHEGSVVVELAPVGDPGLVPTAVASALSVPEVPGQRLTDALVGHLRHRRLLLVLDNCEHLLECCARLVEALLAGCPQLRILATSREPLSFVEERVMQVLPLAVPGPGEVDPEDLMERYAAVDLFVERAQAVEPDFALNAYVAPAVVEICRRLDGIPLAIELAAARVEMLTPAEIAWRLDDRFGVLTQGSRRSSSHHRTLEAALDWSFELLSEPERALLRRLSVFVGGFDLEAVEAVCARDVVDVDEVPRLLGQLVSKSLVAREGSSESTPRHHLLETVRAYGAERLDAAGEVGALREAHASFCLALAERAEPELTGPGQREWLARLESERENLRSALEWALGHGKDIWALRLSGSLTLFWRTRCHFSEGRDLLEAAIGARKGDAPPAVLAKALLGAGLLASMAGDASAAVPLLEQSLAIADQLGDERGRARALMVLGATRRYRGDPAALRLLEESARLAREAADRWCLAHALGFAGLERCHLDQLSAARPLLEECVTVAREARDSGALRFGLLGLGELAGRQGDYALAGSVFQEALAVADELGEDYTKATALMHLGQAAIGQGDQRRAGELLDAALALMRVAKPNELVVSLSLRARVACVVGDRGLARSLLEEALPLARAGDPGAAFALQTMGELLVGDGEARAAQRLFEEALDLARSVGDKRQASWALHNMAQLARAERDAKRAALLLNDALELDRQMESTPATLASIEAIAGLAAEAGRPEHAARMLGAATALRKEHGCPRPPADSGRYEADLQLAQDALSPRELEAALAAGANWSLDEVVAQASNGRGESGRRGAGWQSLTDTERQVAALVAEGMTNREIADLLFVSPSTVGNHLTHIYSKLGIQRRMQLARQVSHRAGT